MKQQAFERLVKLVSINLTIIICMLIGREGGYNKATKVFQKEAVDKGYAIYNPTNSVWQWK